MEGTEWWQCGLMLEERSMRLVHCSTSVLACIFTCQGLIKEFKALFLREIHWLPRGERHRANSRLLLRLNDLTDFVLLHFLLQFSPLDLLGNRLRSQVEYAISPVLLAFVLVGELVHCLLSY